MKSPIAKVFAGENLGRFPVWMMRQAGRYLPSYQAIRRNHSFWEMATTGAIAAEVSLLPTRELNVDGVIFFADILTPAHALNLGVEMKESIGPYLENPMRDAKRFSIFETFDPVTHVPFVGEALATIRSAVQGKQTVLGFAGAPWTVGCYLIEGRSSRHFEATRRFAAQDLKGFLKSLSALADSTARYLLYQAEQGAEVVQLFDTWANEIPIGFFAEHYVPILNRIFVPLAERGIPAIYFCKNAHHLDGLLGRLEIKGLSCDSLIPMPEMARRIDGRFLLQGNLDPVFLKVATAEQVRQATTKLVREAQTIKGPVIMNLGHGIIPETPVENVQAFVEAARQSWS